MTERRRLVPFGSVDRPDADLRRHRESHHVRPQKHEKKVARELGGRTQPGSGSKVGYKGDVKTSIDDDAPIGFLIECKRSMGSASLSVKAEWLAKITEEARVSGKIPALAIQFDESVMEAAAASGLRSKVAESDWVAIPLSALKDILAKVGESIE